MWLLLMSLLVSDLSPLGDGDGVMDYYSWKMCRKLLHSGQMTPSGLGILLAQTKHHCMCIQRSCVCVAVQQKQRTSPFCLAYTVHDDHGRSLSHQDLTEIIHRSHIPAVDISPHEEGKSFPIFLKSDTLPAMHIISGDTAAKAGGEIGHITMIKDRSNSGSGWSMHHLTAASGHSFRAFLLEKPKSWASATIVHQQKMLTKRYCAATTVIISCSHKLGELRSAINIKKISEDRITEPQIRQKESTQRVMDIKVLRQRDGHQSLKALVRQHDISQTATLHPGSSATRTSDTSQLEIQRNAASIMKKNEPFNSDEGSTLQKGFHKQLFLKASVEDDGDDGDDDDDDDGFYVKRQLLLVSREKKESINRAEQKRGAAQDDHKEDFNGKIITKQAELRRPEGESETEPSHTNTIENGNRRILAYILQTGSTYKTDNNGVDHKQTLSEVGEENVIMLFLSQAEMEAPAEGKVILSTDTGWEAVNIPIKVPGDPPPITKVMNENFIIEADNSECKCLKKTLFSLYIYAKDRRERFDVKPAESATEETTSPAYTQRQIKETTEKIEHADTNNTPQENTSINHTKQEENVPSEEPAVHSPPSYKMMETGTTTERTAETTAVNTEMKQTTPSSEAFNQGSIQEGDRLPSTEETLTATMSPEPETDTGNTRNIESTTAKPFLGLRMRENIPVDTSKLHDSTENEGRDATNRPETTRTEERNDPGVTSKPPEPIHKHTTIHLPESTDHIVPLCTGLIHRTEAGWKHCMERFAGTGSKTFSSRETVDAFIRQGELERDDTSVADRAGSLLSDDERDHFYYFDGVLKRVQNNYYPYYKIQRRQKRSHENLLSYIQRLTLRNKLSHHDNR